MTLLVAWGCSGSGDFPAHGGAVRSCPGDAEALPGFLRVAGASPLQDKNYYLLTLLQQVSEASNSLRLAPGMQGFHTRCDLRLTEAAEACAAHRDRCADALLFSEEEVEEIGEELARLAGGQALGCSLLEDHMRPSGMFQLHAGKTDGEMLRNAWRDAAEGLRIAFDSHTRSLPPETLSSIVTGTREAHPGPLLFFEPLLRVVVASLEARGRDEAGRYEPLETGENRAALERVPRVDWEAYPYPAMLIPGQGPEEEDIPLTALSRFRCELAAERFAEGVAPFIVLSGGHVHPDRTPYSEAMEMKRYLMEEQGLPENVLFVDPHARHTTTNLRNFARLLHRYGLPTDRHALVTTDPFQALYIAVMLEERCNRELGYLPWRDLNQTSILDIEFLPHIRSMHADPRDPLDP